MHHAARLLRVDETLQRFDMPADQLAGRRALVARAHLGFVRLEGVLVVCVDFLRQVTFWARHKQSADPLVGDGWSSRERGR